MIGTSIRLFRALDLPPAPNPLMTDYSTPIDCETAVRQLWDYLDGRLPAEASREMEAHLAVCGSCPPHFEFARRLRRALAASVPSDALPDEEVRLRDRIRVALQRMADGPGDMQA